MHSSATERTAPLNKINSESHCQGEQQLQLAWVLNEPDLEKSYDGLKLPLGPAPVRGLKLLLCKEGVRRDV
jgi:hypothetical protein